MTTETPPRQPKLQVKAWRKHRGLTVEQLAERSSMSTGNVSQIENGRQGATLASMQALADALETDVVSLFYLPGEHPATLSPAQRDLLNVVRGLDDQGLAHLTATLADLVKLAASKR